VKCEARLLTLWENTAATVAQHAEFPGAARAFMAQPRVGSDSFVLCMNSSPTSLESATTIEDREIPSRNRQRSTCRRARAEGGDLVVSLERTSSRGVKRKRASAPPKVCPGESINSVGIVKYHCPRGTRGAPKDVETEECLAFCSLEQFVHYPNHRHRDEICILR